MCNMEKAGISFAEMPAIIEFLKTKPSLQMLTLIT